MRGLFNLFLVIFISFYSLAHAKTEKASEWRCEPFYMNVEKIIIQLNQDIPAPNVDWKNFLDYYASHISGVVEDFDIETEIDYENKISIPPPKTMLLIMNFAYIKQNSSNHSGFADLYVTWYTTHRNPDDLKVSDTKAFKPIKRSRTYARQMAGVARIQPLNPKYTEEFRKEYFQNVLPKHPGLVFDNDFVGAMQRTSCRILKNNFAKDCEELTGTSNKIYRFKDIKKCDYPDGWKKID